MKLDVSEKPYALCLTYDRSITTSKWSAIGFNSRFSRIILPKCKVVLKRIYFDITFV